MGEIYQQRGVINSMASVTLLYIEEMYDKFIPFLVLSVVLIAVDCRFGVQAAKVRGETIRTSRMVRRSINKFVDYICWIALAVIFGHAYGDILGIPILSAIILLVIYGIEITSCFNNYFDSKGIKKKINFFRLIKADVGKALEDMADVTEEEKDGDNN